MVLGISPLTYTGVRDYSLWRGWGRNFPKLIQSGLIQSEEAKEAINKDSLLPIEIDPSVAADSPIEGDYLTGAGNRVDG